MDVQLDLCLSWTLASNIHETSLIFLYLNTYKVNMFINLVFNKCNQLVSYFIVFVVEDFVNQSLVY